MTQERRELEVGTLFLSNDKNNFIAENVLVIFCVSAASLKYRYHMF